MKITHTKDKGFTPFTISIEVESKRELEFLWAFANSSTNEKVLLANRNSDSEKIVPFSSDDKWVRDFSSGFFNALNENLKP